MNGFDLVSGLILLIGSMFVLAWYFHRPSNYRKRGKRKHREVWYRDPVRLQALIARNKAFVPEGRLQPFETDGVWYIIFRDVMMLDWDIGEGPNKISDDFFWGTVIPLIYKDGATWRIYKTPGGYRAFQVGFASWRRGADREMELLHCDPAYIACTREYGGFTCRISPKKGRVGDYICSYLTTIIGEDKQEMNPDIMEDIKTHDLLCAHYRGETPEPSRPSEDLLHSFIDSYWKEPWEEVHRAALRDWTEENIDSIQPDLTVESDFEVLSVVNEKEYEDIPF